MEAETAEPAAPAPERSAAASPTHANLVFVPTPIGNLGDITLRALEVLRQAAVIACEDTRHSRPLLSHFGIRAELVSLHGYNEAERLEPLLRRVEAGELVAVISDAGTPLISDPGHRLLRAALEREIGVEVLPGPCALIPALAASGLASDRFSFQGFLPQKSGRRLRVLEEALARAETTIFYESPHRLAKTLAALVELAPGRALCVARELSKRHETFHRGTATELAAAFECQPPRGEIVLLVAGADEAGAESRPEADGGEGRGGIPAAG